MFGDQAEIRIFVHVTGVRLSSYNCRTEEKRRFRIRKYSYRREMKIPVFEKVPLEAIMILDVYFLYRVAENHLATDTLKQIRINGIYKNPIDGHFDIRNPENSSGRTC